jgi:hypothetical protein
MKYRILTALIAVFLMFPLLYAVAFTETDEPTENAIPITEWFDLFEMPPITLNPFAPSGTGTVVDTATESDGKVFYTITTPDEHIFYLIIDKQRNTENVYFLNAVTIADLLPLAEDYKPPVTVPPIDIPNTPIEPTPIPEPLPQDEQPQDSGNMGTIIFVAVILVGGGGAGWYFKIYRPKRQSMSSGDEYEPHTEETDYNEDWDEESGDDELP